MQFYCSEIAYYILALSLKQDYDSHKKSDLAKAGQPHREGLVTYDLVKIIGYLAQHTLYETAGGSRVDF